MSAHSIFVGMASSDVTRRGRALSGAEVDGIAGCHTARWRIPIARLHRIEIKIVSGNADPAGGQSSLIPAGRFPVDQGVGLYFPYAYDRINSTVVPYKISEAFIFRTTSAN